MHSHLALLCTFKKPAEDNQASPHVTEFKKPDVPNTLFTFNIYVFLRIEFVFNLHGFSHRMFQVRV